MSGHFVASHACPICGHPLDVAVNAGPQDCKPKPGDFTICAWCSSVLRFQDDFSLKIITEADKQNPDVAATWDNIMEAQDKLRATNPFNSPLLRHLN